MRLGNIIAAGIACLLFVGTVAPVAAQMTPAEPAFIVGLETDGSATVTTVSTYDLTAEDERQAFKELQNDTATREDFRMRYRDRLAAVASDAENATEREMSVTDAAIDLKTSDEGETGVVALSAEWEGLASTDGDTLIVTEPFASGFTPDRRFVVIAPGGYAVSSVTPSPDDRSGGALVWAAGTDLGSFEVAFAPTETTADNGTTEGRDNGETNGSAPGFGLVAAIVALVATALLARQR